MSRSSTWLVAAVAAAGLAGLVAERCEAQTVVNRPSAVGGLQTRFNLSGRPPVRVVGNPPLGAVPGGYRQIARRPPAAPAVYVYPVYHNGSLYSRTFDYGDAVRLQRSLSQYRGGNNTIGQPTYWRGLRR
jgi:hypothetical protein